MSKHRKPFSSLCEALKMHGEGGKHARRPETMLVYVEERDNGVATGSVFRGEGDDVEAIPFSVEDNEPDDVWGPILSRIAEELGLNGSPEHCDGGTIAAHVIEGVVEVLGLRHDGTPS